MPEPSCGDPSCFLEHDNVPKRERITLAEARENALKAARDAEESRDRLAELEARTVDEPADIVERDEKAQEITMLWADPNRAASRHHVRQLWPDFARMLDDLLDLQGDL